MTARNPLLASPPFAVEDSLVRLGQRLRTARLRRNLTVAEVGKKIGAGSRAVGDAEKGKPSTSVAVYAALLWAFDLIRDLDTVADPSHDVEGIALAKRQTRIRARQTGGLDNDF
ncbi:helix-turn-helix transcriptional regulator [Acidiphilium sp. PA]|uniref:Helix-turn-helix transcriptional regulator n=1 Tax=Acidiphilium acidophilum TaxID=76588 RepID=A0AAW9DKS4_ACIAO|nr:MULTISPECIES: helix-turn-helix transcriptional regulator [Acidiphilium]MCW8308804.1 helix-turn-helix transcriptional regulator [Acidiphilium sp. PA]MDX5929222.1 helix-turn-helix transcriptional regulator [Acidiphilium acidophilum]